MGPLSHLGIAIVIFFALKLIVLIIPVIIITILPSALPCRSSNVNSLSVSQALLLPRPILRVRLYVFLFIVFGSSCSGSSKESMDRCGRLRM